MDANFLLLLLSSFFLFSSAAPSAPQLSGAASGCDGCAGSGGSSASSGGSCGSAMVSITVTVTSGKCKWVLGELEDLSCGQARGCVPQVTRSWSGMGANSPLDFCVQIEDDLLCLSPAPNAGVTGSGSDSRASAAMGCSNSSANTRSYSVSSPTCGLTASAQAGCTGCNGLF